MKVLVTGAKGQLGSDLIKQLAQKHHDVLGVDIEEMDITDSAQVKKVICDYAPDCVIHCAAWTAVDAAEDNEAACRRVNALGTENIAGACKTLNCKMVYISTDYVFDGEGTHPWAPDDNRNPLNVYGQTKYEGELAVEKLEKYFIVRIAWVFGLNGNNFIKTMLRLAENHDSLTVVNDQIGTPTYTYDLARLIIDIAQSDKYGKYHVTNEGEYISWYDFAQAIFKIAGKKISVKPVTSDCYPAKAKRPHNSRMDRTKLVENGFTPLPLWQDALERYINEIGEIDNGANQGL